MKICKISNEIFTSRKFTVLVVIIIFPLSLILPSTALTVENVLNELKEVNWNTLCDGYTLIGGILELHYSQRKRIEKDFATEDERRTAAISFWLTYHPYASWRLLIHTLKVEWKHNLSAALHPYAEKLTGILFLVLSLIVKSLYQ